MEKFMLYFGGGAMLIYFTFWKLIPFLKKTKRITKGIFSSIYINKKATENEEEYRKIAIGALYSEQQTAYINSLTTGLGKAHMTKILSKWWGIDSTKEAIESLDYLKNKGFRFYFKTVANAFKKTNEEEQKRVIINGFDSNDAKYEEDIQKAFQQLVNLKETWEELTENNIVSTQEELEEFNNIGWDCGRLVFLSRTCYDAGYINANEAWRYIDKAYQIAIENFKNWEDFSKSYIIGRGMWGGIECGNQGIMSIARGLLKKEKSPWVQMTLK